MGAQSRAFLAPLQQKMVEFFNPSPLNGWEYFGDQTLQPCSPDPGHVSNVFGSWAWNGFIFGPVYSTLVSKIPQEEFLGKSFTQQDMIDKACIAVNDMENLSYYPLSWQVIAKMTLNGDVALAGELFNGPSPPTIPSPPTSSGPMCCSQNFKDCVTWCGSTESSCTSCTA